MIEAANKDDSTHHWHFYAHQVRMEKLAKHIRETAES